MTAGSPMGAPAALGFVGLGAMGAPMTTRLLEAGNTVFVYDRDGAAVSRMTERGAIGADSPKAVADRASVIFVSLPNAAIVREVALGTDGIAAGDSARHYVDVSTTGPAMAEQVANALADRGIAAVDAPVSGGPSGATAGRLTFMVSGTEAAIAAVRPLLELLGSKLFVVGEAPGLGQTAKVLNNLVSATCIAITSEATALAVKAGLDPAVLLSVIDASSGANNAAADKFPKQVMTRKFAHGFRLELMAKDVRMCLDEARRQDFPMLLGGMVDELWRLANTQERSGADCTEFVRMIEGWSGVTVESTLSVGER